MAAFYNQAKLSYGGKEVYSNIVTAEITETLTLTKTALSSEYSPGDKVVYAVNAVNSGANAYTDLTFSDNLGAYTLGELSLTPLTYVADSLKYFVNGDPTAAPTVSAGPPLSVTGITVPANGNITLIYEAEANSYAPPCAQGSITNTASLSGCGISDLVSATETVNAKTGSALSISKSVSPEVLTGCSEVTYTILIQNTGGTAVTADENVIISDTLNPVLTSLNVYLNDTLLTAGTGYTYDLVSGEFATTQGTITVPAASCTQNTETGVWTVTPGITALKLTGQI